MKANELMIGDWVLYNETPQQILEISGIEDEVYLETDELVHQSEIQPIPLTPEILEKNWFEKQWQDNYEYFDDDENLNITFHSKNSNYTNGAYDYIDIEKGCLTINEMPIAFVHELQHALRLCESEKEIEL